MIGRVAYGRVRQKFEYSFPLIIYLHLQLFLHCDNLVFCSVTFIYNYMLCQCFLLWYLALCKFRALFVLTVLSQRSQWYVKDPGKWILSTWFIILFFCPLVFPQRVHWKLAPAPTEFCVIYFKRLSLSVMPEHRRYKIINLIKSLVCLRNVKIFAHNRFPHLLWSKGNSLGLSKTSLFIYFSSLKVFPSLSSC